MQISQLLKVQIQKFLCLSYREFPEFSRTHLTLICKSIFNASRSLQTKRTCYLTGLVCRNSLFICFKTIKWRLFSSKHSLERALNSLQSNWLFQPKFSISRDSALANILRICSDITHNSQYFRNVDFSCPIVHVYTKSD